MNMKVLGYVRVSTGDQAREGVSLDAQRSRILPPLAFTSFNILVVRLDILGPDMAQLVDPYDGPPQQPYHKVVSR